jgi:hypothetical protein
MLAPWLCTTRTLTRLSMVLPNCVLSVALQSQDQPLVVMRRCCMRRCCGLPPVSPKPYPLWRAMHGRAVAPQHWTVQEWPGNQVFLLDGRVVLNSKWFGILGTIFLVGALEGVFLGLVAPRLRSVGRLLAIISGCVLLTSFASNKPCPCLQSSAAFCAPRRPIHHCRVSIRMHA